MVRRFGQPMEVDNPIAELCGYGTVSGAGFVCETCWNIFPANDAPYGCPVCNAPTTAPDEGQDAPEEVQEEGQDDLASRLQPLDAEDPTGGLAGVDAGYVDDGALVEENLNKISNPPF